MCLSGLTKELFTVMASEFKCTEYQIPSNADYHNISRGMANERSYTKTKNIAAVQGTLFLILPTSSQGFNLKVSVSKFGRKQIQTQWHSVDAELDFGEECWIAGCLAVTGIILPVFC